MFLHCSFSCLSCCFSSSQHPPSSDVTAPNDRSHEPGAYEDDHAASSHSDSDLGSRTSHQTTNEDSDQASDQGDVKDLNTVSDNNSGSEVILDDQATDILQLVSVNQTVEVQPTRGGCICWTRDVVKLQECICGRPVESKLRNSNTTVKCGYWGCEMLWVSILHPLLGTASQ